MPTKELCLVYMTLIQSIIDYGITLWGFSGKENVKKILRFQKRCARLITGEFDYDVSSQYLIQSLNWLNIKERIEYFVSVTMYKCINESAPSYIKDNVTMFSHLHDYVTRDELMVQLPATRTNYMKRSFKFQGPVSWNALPYDIRSAQSLISFKSLVKDHLRN